MTIRITTRKPRIFNASAGTHTREGFEPHLKITTVHGLIFHAPVMVRPPLIGEELPRTRYGRQGRKVYALPGGEVLAV